MVLARQATIPHTFINNTSVVLWFGWARDPDLANQYCLLATVISSEAGTQPHKIQSGSISSFLLK